MRKSFRIRGCNPKLTSYCKALADATPIAPFNVGDYNIRKNLLKLLQVREGNYFQEEE